LGEQEDTEVIDGVRDVGEIDVWHSPSMAYPVLFPQQTAERI
jgi:hypothetical protein